MQSGGLKNQEEDSGELLHLENGLRGRKKTYCTSHRTTLVSIKGYKKEPRVDSLMEVCAWSK